VIAIHHRVMDNQQEQQTFDTQLIEVDLPDGGAFTTVTSLGDGGWCAAGVPSGDAYFKLSTPAPGVPLYVFTPQTTLDLSNWTYGHIAAQATLSNTALTYSNTGTMQPPWLAEDHFDIFSFGSGLVLSPITFDAGVTSVSASFNFDPNVVVRPSLSAPPDVIYLGRMFDAGTWSVLTEYAAGTSTMVDGAATAVTTSGFVDVNRNNSLTLTWVAQNTAGNYNGDTFPGALFAPSPRAELDLVPNLADAGPADQVMQLVLSVGSGLTNANLVYGDPFATNELIESEVHTNVLLHFPDAGTANPAKIVAFDETNLPVTSASMVLDLALSPPRSVAVNSQPTSRDAWVYASAPVSLSWIAPSLGTAQWYRIEAYPMSHSGAVSSIASTPVWRLLIPDASVTSVTVPPLTAGSVYVFRVVAGNATPYDPAAPLQPRNDNNSADAITGPVIIR
jgi:hypothetical protein